MALRATALLLTVLLGMGPLQLAAQPGSAPPPVVINEVLYAPSPSDNEFIELYNRSSQAVDLQAFSFSDNRATPIPIATTPTPLPPGGYAVLVRNAAAFSAAFPGVSFLSPPDWDALNNGGDAVVLYRDGAAVDRVPYRPDWGGASGQSLERIDPAGPSDRAFNFGASTDPAGATPGRQNSRYAPDTQPPVPLFAEVVAPDTVFVVFDEPLAAPVPSAFALDDGARPAALRRGPRDDRLRLAFGQPVSGRRLRVDGVQDLVGNARADTSLLLGYPPSARDLALSEVLFAPRADDFDNAPNQPEYVEIANRAARGISLRGLFWTDVPDETGTADTTRIGADVLAVLPPSGWAVAYAAGRAADDPAADDPLRAAFPDVATGLTDAVLLPIGATTLGLRNDGDRIRLHRADGHPVAEVNYRPDWHAAALADPRGVALERISLTAPADRAANWTSSVAPAGGTPGQPNSVRLGPSAPPDDRLRIEPSPFSPDGDGFDEVTRIRYALDAAVASVRIRIYDAMGRRVRTLAASRLASRTGEVLWDGQDDDGRTARVGIYVVLFEALDAAGGRVITLKRPVVLARPLH